MGRQHFPILLILLSLFPAAIQAETPEEETARLVRELVSADAESRDKIAKRIFEIGPEAREAIVPLLQLDAECEYGAFYWWCVGDMGAEPVPALCRIAGESAGENRERALWSLGSLGHDAAIAIPLLVELMRNKEEPPSMRVAAAEAAVRNGMHLDSVVAALVEMLAEEDRQIAAQAADLLGDLGPRANAAGEAVAKAAVEHPNPYVRNRCLLFLDEIEPDQRRVALTLAAALSDAEAFGAFGFGGRVYETAIGELVELGKDAIPAIPAMLELLQSDEIRDVPRCYRELTETLASCGPAAKKAIPLLRADIRPREKRNLPLADPILGSFGEFEPESGEFAYMRVLAAKALIRLAPNDDDAFSTLIEIFTDNRWDDGDADFHPFGKSMNPREEAAGGLGYCQQRRDQVIPLLRKACTESSDSDLQATCAWALARLGAKNTKPLPLLESRLYLQPELRPAEYARLLGEDVQAYVPDLIDSALSYERERSTYFFQVLMRLKNDFTEPLATQAAKNLIADDDANRAEEVFALLGGRATTALPRLLDALGSDDWRTRARACRVLGVIKLQPETVVPALAERVRDTKPLVRARAVEAIGNFGPAARTHLDAIDAAGREKYLTVRLAAMYAARNIRGVPNPRQFPADFDPFKNDDLAARLDIKRLRQIAARRQAWAESLVGLAKPKTNRQAIVNRMKDLLRIEPVLQTEKNRNFMPLLEATIAPSGAKPDTIEAAIDGFVDMTDEYAEDNPRVLQVIQSGFEAIPTLIEHFDDPRITRCGDSILHDDTLGFVQVGDIVRETLASMSRKNFNNAKAAKKWWDNIRPLGEEKYLQQTVIDRAIRGDRVGDTLWNWAEQKVPRKIAEAYQRVLDDGFHSSRRLAKAIGCSTLTKEQKTEALLQGTKQRDFEHRWAALCQLLNLDENTFEKLAIEEIDALPLLAEKPTDLHKAFRATYELANTSDERVWNYFTRHVTRADVVLRVEYLEAINYYGINDRSREQRIAFAAAFLDDQEVRIVGRNARVKSAKFRRIEVRDIAAWNLAYLLGLTVHPDVAWTAEQWSELRASDGEALKQHNKRKRPMASREQPCAASFHHSPLTTHHSLFTKCSRSRVPSSVKKLSGWNWTPNNGNSRWRIPMISRSPSAGSVQAQTSNASLSVSG